MRSENQTLQKDPLMKQSHDAAVTAINHSSVHPFIFHQPRLHSASTLMLEGDQDICTDQDSVFLLFMLLFWFSFYK